MNSHFGRSTFERSTFENNTFNHSSTVKAATVGQWPYILQSLAGLDDQQTDTRLKNKGLFPDFSG